MAPEEHVRNTEFIIVTRHGIHVIHAHGQWLELGPGSG